MTGRPDPFNLIITGVGGQGNVLLSGIIGRALIGQGWHVVVGETFGLSQRGGSVQSHIRFSRGQGCGPLIPVGRAHLVLGLEPMETLRILPQYGGPELRIIANSRPVPPLNVISGEARYPREKEIKAALKELSARLWWINATAAAQELGAAVMANMVMLGALCASGQVPLEAGALEDSLRRSLPPERLEMNLAAFNKGTALIR